MRTSQLTFENEIDITVEIYKITFPFNCLCRCTLSYRPRRLLDFGNSSFSAKMGTAMTTKSLFDMTLSDCVIYILVSIIILLSNSVGSINRRNG